MTEGLAGALARFVREEAALLFLLLDEQGVVCAANPYAAQVLGASPVGRRFTELLLGFGGRFDLDTLDTGGTQRYLLNLATRDLPQTLHFRFLRADGRLVALGELNHPEIETLRRDLVATNNDLSNLTRALHKQNAELRTLNELKNEFLGMAAHDLRNPLGAIMLYSEYLSGLLNGRIASDELEMVRDIYGLSEFMLRLINDLLDYSVIESGRLELALEPTDFAGWVDKVVELNRALARRKQIHIELTRQGAAGIVTMDSGKIKQVINNLTSNAVKFSHPGTRVDVLIDGRPDGVAVTVRDQGPGIPADELETLFRPFARTSVKSTGGESSTGLGLAICHRIVTAHHGRLWVESRVGEGSAFHFSLPRGD